MALRHDHVFIEFTCQARTIEKRTAMVEVLCNPPSWIDRQRIRSLILKSRNISFSSTVISFIACGPMSDRKSVWSGFFSRTISLH